MDERTRLFLWVLTSVGGFGLLFGLFGAFVGYVTLREGRTGGTTLGLSVARAFERIGQRDLSPLVQALVVGFVDGLSFGAFVGVLLGFFAGWHVPGEGKIIGLALLAALLLVVFTIGIGLFAGSVNSVGVRAVVGLFAGGMLGALGGYGVAGTEGLFYGILGGAALGALFSRGSRE